MPEIPFAFQWSITENELLPLKNSSDGYLKSASIFDIPEFEYYLQIFPNGHEEESRGKTSILFYLEFTNIKKVEADYNFTIESANFSKNGHRVYDKPYGWGKYIRSTDDFFDPEKKFIVDGKVTVKVHGMFKFETDDEEPTAMEQKWEGGEVGNELWKNDDMKDFTISVDDKELKVHKLILGVRSEVFTAMFNSNMKEATENKVTITDFPFVVVETGIKLIYHCNFISSLSLGELMELLQFLDKYNLSTLKAKVEEILYVEISSCTVVELTNCSVQTNSFKLKEECMEFLMAAFLSKTPLADIDGLDKDVLLEMFKNSLFQVVQTEK